MGKKVLTVLILTCFLGCSESHGPPTNLTQTSPVTPELASLDTPDIGSIAIPCNDSGAYMLETTEDPSRQAKNVVVIVREATRNTIHLPNQSDVNGFALDWAKKTSDGIEISVEYGSRHYFNKRFIFDCRKDELFLTRIKVESFDKSKPDRWTNREIQIKPAVPIGKFNMMTHLTN